MFVVQEDAGVKGDLDHGPRGALPQRMCALTREVHPVDELLRFVLTPAGEAVADLKRKLPGRGLWLSAERSTIEQAVKRGIFQKGFKKDVKGLAALAGATETLLVRSVCDALAMAAKAGQAVSGSGKVSDLVEGGEAIALIHATDGAEDGIRKLDASFKARSEGRPVRIVRVLTSGELDLALGRANVIHAALRAGPASKTFLSRCQTLERFRGVDGADALKTTGAAGFE